MNPEEIKKFMELLEKASAAAQEKKSEGLSTQEQVELLKAVASDETVRKQYAETRAALILPRVAAQSTVRRIFMPENLSLSAGQPSYPVTPDYPNVASYLPKFGGATTFVQEATELFIPTFRIQGGGRYDMDIAENGRIDMAAFTTQGIADDITRKEENAGWRLIKATLSGCNTDQTVYCSGTTEAFQAFTKKAVNKMVVQMDIQRRNLTDIYVSPRSMGDVREWSSNQIDFNTQREIFVNAGLPGQSIWNVKLNKVYDSTIIADTEAWGFDGTKFGFMPINYNVRTFDDPMAVYDHQIGIIARERVGFGCADSWAFVKAVMDSTHTTTACSTF